MAGTTLSVLKNTMDDWVKDMNSKVSGLHELPQSVLENTDNIQHNYELIQEMRREVDDLKEEIKMLKMMQLLVLKEKTLKGGA